MGLGCPPWSSGISSVTTEEQRGSSCSALSSSRLLSLGMTLDAEGIPEMARVTPEGLTGEDEIH